MAYSQPLAMGMSTARGTMTKGGLPLHVLVICSAVAGATPCLHPHGHKGKCIHQRCVMGVSLLRVFAPFQGGGFLTAHHGFFFCLLFTTTVQFTEQPSVCPTHYSGAQEPCQPIDALSPPLLQEPCQPIDDLPRILLHLFVKVSPGRVCNDYNLTFLCWCEMTNLSATFFIFANFCSVIDRQHLCHLKTPCCDSWDIQCQSLSLGFKAFSCNTLLPGHGACICLATF